MKRKEYDDDLLVELIARGEMSHARIAERVGIDRVMVGLIARGRTRRELQDQINTKMRKYLIERRRPGRPPGDRRRKKEYDDDLLVDLLARGEMSCGQIADRIGISRGTVGMIACGRLRPDLQDQLITRMRAYLADRRRRGSRPASEAGAWPAPTAYRNKEYDDELVVELIARGNLSYRRIAQRVGVSPSTIRTIARGDSRPDLQERIAAMTGGIRQEAHRLGARWLRGLLAQHIRDGIEGTGVHARKCREFAMTFIENHSDPGDARPTWGLPTPGLTDEDYEIIARLKGAPPDDDEDTAEPR